MIEDQNPPEKNLEIRNRQALRSLRRSVFLISLPFGVFDFVLPIYGKGLGASAVEIGLFFSIFSIMLVVMRPFVGYGVDRIGRKPFFLGGAFGYSLTMLVFSFAVSVPGVFLARALNGLSSAMFWLSVNAITADSAPEKLRGRNFGRISQTANQGGILGTFIGFYILFSMGMKQGWQPMFFFYAAAALIAGSLAFWKLPETLPTSVVVEKSNDFQWSRPFILLLLVTLTTAASWAMVSPILMIFLQERLNVPFNGLALAFLPSALVWAIFPSRLGRLADRFGRKPLMLIGLGAASVSSFFIPGVGSLVSLAILWAFQAICYAAGDPAEQALVADLTGGNERGRGYGFYTTASGLGMAIGPIAGGWLYDAVSPAAPFYANGVILALCLLILAAFLKVPASQNQVYPNENI